MLLVSFFIFVFVVTITEHPTKLPLVVGHWLPLSPAVASCCLGMCLSVATHIDAEPHARLPTPAHFLCEGVPSARHRTRGVVVTERAHTTVGVVVDVVAELPRARAAARVRLAGVQCEVPVDGVASRVPGGAQGRLGGGRVPQAG